MCRQIFILEMETPLDREYREGKIGIEEYALRKRKEIEEQVREEFGLKKRDEKDGRGKCQSISA